MGRVVEINLAESEGAPTFAIDAVRAIPGRGLEGDRYQRLTGDEPLAPKRQVTLIESEALEALARDHDIELNAAGTRRNICTREVPLNHLVGCRFRVGEALLVGIELCEPCGTIERMSGIKGLVQALLHRGGLRAEILEAGTIRVGDPITRE